jgi:hypothetical protein
MYGDPKAKIEEIIRNGYDFKFGDYLSKGFSLLQKNLGGFIVFTLVFIILSAVINFIPFIGWLANSLFISPALTVGFYLVARKLDLGKNTEFGDFFKGFDFVGQLAITALVMTGIILATLIPFYFAGGGSEFMNWYLEILKNPATAAENPVPDIPSWSVLLVLPAIYLGIAYSWSYMFVAFYNMSFWDAMESSRKLITQKWLIYFAFMIVLGLVAAAGFILLCVGILAAIPAIYCMQYAAFADVTKLNSETGNTDNIEQHLVE